MAGIVHLLNIDAQYRRAFRRDRILRDRTNPLDKYDDVELHERFRFPREDILLLIDELRGAVEHETDWNGALSAEQQIMIALRFYATGCYHTLAGDVLDVHKSTASRAIRRVSVALEQRLREYVYLPQLPEYIDGMKAQFYVSIKIKWCPVKAF
jgi:hypothetical protein